jgi:hypothetical protein
MGLWTSLVLAVLSCLPAGQAAKPRPKRTLPYFPWREGLPSARAMHAMAAAGDGSVWLHGGLTEASSAPSDELVKLDPHERRWHAVTTAGPRPRRIGHSLVAVNGNRLVLFGGRLDLSDDGLSDELWTLDLLAAAAWTLLTSPATSSASGVSSQRPSARWFHTMCAVGNTALLFGGETDLRRSDELWSLNVSAAVWTLLTSPASGASSQRPSARWGHTMCAVGSTALLFGGYTDSVDRRESGRGREHDLWSLNVSAAAWTLLTSSASGASSQRPSARYGHTMFAVGSTALLFGGETDSAQSDELGS